jgi:hypothetical protein
VSVVIECLSKITGDRDPAKYMYLPSTKPIILGVDNILALVSASSSHNVQPSTATSRRKWRSHGVGEATPSQYKSNEIIILIYSSLCSSSEAELETS